MKLQGIGGSGRQIQCQEVAADWWERGCKVQQIDGEQDCKFTADRQIAKFKPEGLEPGGSRYLKWRQVQDDGDLTSLQDRHLSHFSQED